MLSPTGPVERPTDRVTDRWAWFLFEFIGLVPPHRPHRPTDRPTDRLTDRFTDGRAWFDFGFGVPFGAVWLDSGWVGLDWFGLVPLHRSR